MKTLSIIGCGKVGAALGRLWHLQSIFLINDILNQSLTSSEKACNRVGSGRALSAISHLQASDVFLIAVPDDQIRSACDELRASAVLREGDIVFHCSGALSSTELASASADGAVVASVHPVKTFTDNESEMITFSGVQCAIEGDEKAVISLTRAFEAIGGELFAIDPESKLLYHSASVFACNYLTALLEVSHQAYRQAGLNEETTLRLMQPLVRETLTNVFEKGAVEALTGPIARGDAGLVAKQLAAVEQWSPEFAQIYQSLGEVALSLTKQAGRISADNLQKLAYILNKRP